MKELKRWVRNARAGTLFQSLMPSVTAVVLSVGGKGFSWLLSFLALTGVAFAHLAANLLDDYFDYRSHKTGYRDALSRAGFRAYTAKCPYLTDGTATPKELLRAALAFCAAAILCAGVILFFRGALILIVAAVTAFLGVFYSAPPFRLSYHGLGEPIIGIVFGPLNVIGVSVSACGSVSGEAALAGAVFGLLVTNILYSHSVLDYAADQSVGKRTLAALFHSDVSRLRFSAVLIFAPYLLTAAAVLSRVLTSWTLLVLLTLPLSVDLIRSMKAFTEDPKAPVVWKKWYGRPAMEWSRAQALGLDWFLQRWMLSRNLVAATAVCWCTASLLSKVMK